MLQLGTFIFFINLQQYLGKIKHFRTDNSVESVTKEIKQHVRPWLGETEASVIPLAKVFDTPGLGDSDDIYPRFGYPGRPRR